MANVQDVPTVVKSPLSRVSDDSTPLLSDTSVPHHVAPVPPAGYGSFRTPLSSGDLDGPEQVRGPCPPSLPSAASGDGGDTVQLELLSPVLVASTPKALFNVVITIVGSGVLGLPYTFMRSGWLLGPLALLLSAVLTLYCMLLLVDCRKRLQERGVEVATYTGVGRHTCGVVGERAVGILVIISQGGCCIAYLVFIAQNLSSIFCPQPPHAAPLCLSVTSFIVLATPFQVLLSWVRSLSGLVPFSVAADVANLLAMALVIRADLQNYQDLSNLQAFTGWANVPFALGVACYCFEGFAMTLPLEASMKHPKEFPRLLSLAIAAITVLYLVFGLTGYAVFKDSTQEIITLNLPNDWSTVAVKLGLCLGLFFTFPVMMQPVHDILEELFLRSSLFASCMQPHSKARDILQRLVRTVMVVLAAYIAARIPAFARFIALVGSSVCACLAFVLPGLFHFILTGAEEQTFTRFVSRGIDVFLVAFGIIFAIVGTIDSIRNL